MFIEQDPAELASWIGQLGGDRLILGSDLGQRSSPPHPEEMLTLIRALLDLGVSRDEPQKMIKCNPAVLLNLPA